jgi:hypothetical protein
VIDAAETIFLVAAEEEGGAAMGADVAEEADFAGGGAEADEVLAEQADAEGWAVGNDLIGGVGGQPVLPHEVAHGSARSDVTDQLIVRSGQHGRCPPIKSEEFKVLITEALTPAAPHHRVSH